MPSRNIEIDGARWNVFPSGYTTQYDADAHDTPYKNVPPDSAPPGIGASAAVHAPSDQVSSRPSQFEEASR